VHSSYPSFCYPEFTCPSATSPNASYPSFYNSCACRRLLSVMPGSGPCRGLLSIIPADSLCRGSYQLCLPAALTGDLVSYACRWTVASLYAWDCTDYSCSNHNLINSQVIFNLTIVRDTSIGFWV
jgi:hypothetical protein